MSRTRTGAPARGRRLVDEGPGASRSDMELLDLCAGALLALVLDIRNLPAKYRPADAKLATLFGVAKASLARVANRKRRA